MGTARKLLLGSSIEEATTRSVNLMRYNLRKI